MQDIFAVNLIDSIGQPLRPCLGPGPLRGGLQQLLGNPDQPLIASVSFGIDDPRLLVPSLLAAVLRNCFFLVGTLQSSFSVHGSYTSTVLYLERPYPRSRCLGKAPECHYTQAYCVAQTTSSIKTTRPACNQSMAVFITQQSVTTKYATGWHL